MRFKSPQRFAALAGEHEKAREVEADPGKQVSLTAARSLAGGLDVASDGLRSPSSLPLKAGEALYCAHELARGPGGKRFSLTASKYARGGGELAGPFQRQSSIVRC